MSLLDAVRAAVSIANTVTGPLQATVVHDAYADIDAYGAWVEGAGTSRTALVEYKQRQVRTATGELVLSTATVTFLDPTVAVDTRDRLTLPDGRTPPILAVDGALIDAVTGLPILRQVYL